MGKIRSCSMVYLLKGTKLKGVRRGRKAESKIKMYSENFYYFIVERSVFFRWRSY